MNLKLILRSLIPFVLIIFCFQDMFGQDTSSYNPQKVYSLNQIRKDFEIFQKALEEAHPGLYSHVSKEKVTAKFSEASKSLNHDMTELEFRKIIANTISYIKDGHTNAAPSDNLMHLLMTSAKMLPLKVHYLNNKLYTLYSLNNIIQKGSEILAINKKPAKDIINIIFSYLSSDGDMQTGKERSISEWFSSYYYSFIEQPENFYIEYAEPDNTKRKNVFISATSENKDSIFSTPYSSVADYSFEFINDTVPLLTIRTFGKQEGHDYSKFLDSSFEIIKNKKGGNLIIDLRGNGGGDDVYGSLLYSYIANQDFPYLKELITVTDSITFLQYTNLDSSFNQYVKERVDKVNPHLFKVKNKYHPNLSPQKPQKNSFSGNVYILINGGSFSTTRDFCSIVHTNKRGKFVGEETGGNYSGNCSEVFLPLTLPNTKIKVYIPLVKCINAVSDNASKTRGIRPDYPFTPSIQDVINNNDSMLQYTLGLIKDHKNK
jgi:Peptidase family S41